MKTPSRTELRRLRALSIRQPWAWLILHGGKHLENRSWAARCRHRGPLLIHAAKKVEVDAWAYVRDLGRAGELQGFRWQDLPAPSEIETGVLVGLVDLDGVVTRSASPWFMGPAALVLKNPRPFDEPVPCLGMLGLFRPFSTTARIRT